jgi:hypothetical protein
VPVCDVKAIGLGAGPADYRIEALKPTISTFAFNSLQSQVAQAGRYTSEEIEPTDPRFDVLRLPLFHPPMIA